MKKLNLDILKEGLPGFSKTVGAFLAEAALVCLEQNNHQSGVLLEVTGEYTAIFEIVWTGNIDSVVKEGWRDIVETTEYGATAIAILLLRELTDFQYFERMRQDEIGDYLIKQSKEVTPFSFLEISGIWNENAENNVSIRVNTKVRKISKKAKSKLELFTIVTEFSKPEAKISRNEFS